jgi:hypothetical protein
MGRLAMGTNAFGKTSGEEVNGVKETPGPHRTMAWKPIVALGKACGILRKLVPMAVVDISRCSKRR